VTIFQLAEEGGGGGRTNGSPSPARNFTLGIVYVGRQFLIPLTERRFEGSRFKTSASSFPIVKNGRLAFDPLGVRTSGRTCREVRPLRVAGGTGERTGGVPARSVDGIGRAGRFPHRRVGAASDVHTRTKLASHWGRTRRAPARVVATFRGKLVSKLIRGWRERRHPLVRPEPGKPQRAANREIRSRRDLAFASRRAYVGVELEPGAIETGSIRKPSLVKIRSSKSEIFREGRHRRGARRGNLASDESEDPVVRN